MKEKVDCVILNYNDADSCIELVNKIKKYENIKKIIIVDNNSTDNSVQKLEIIKSEKVDIVHSIRNGGYGYGNNLGINKAFEDRQIGKVLVCNPDVAFDEKLINKMIKVMDKTKDCGLVSCLQIDKNDEEFKWCAWSIPSAMQFTVSLGLLIPKLYRNYYVSNGELHKKPICKVDCVSGSLLMISRMAFEKIGGYDENIFLYCEETVLGCKLKEAGFNTYICTDEYYQHLHSVSINKTFKKNMEKRKILLKSHKYVLKKYLKANCFNILFDSVFANITMIEEYIRSVLS